MALEGHGPAHALETLCRLHHRDRVRGSRHRLRLLVGRHRRNAESITRKDSGTEEEAVGQSCNASVVPDPLSFDVNVIDPPGTTPLAGATVELIKRTDRSVIVTTTTDAKGDAKLSAKTGGVALDALLRIRTSPDDAGLRLPLITESQHGIQVNETVTGTGVPPFSLFANAASAVGVTLDPAKTIVQVKFETCVHVGITGVTIAVEGANVFYNSKGPASFDPAATKTGFSGVGTAFNVTPGRTKITVTYDGQPITHEINTVGGEVHFLLMNP